MTGRTGGLPPAASPAPRRANEEEGTDTEPQALDDSDTSSSRGDGPTSYARGWGDGARDALHFVTRLVARGHTPSEIRVFVESRLGHLDEEVRLKRKTLLSTPVGIPVESLVRVQPRGSSSAPAFPPAVPGYNYLFLEETRQVARSFLRELLPRVGRGLAITRLPNELRRMAPVEDLVILHLGVEGTTEEGVEAAESSPTQLTGRVDNFLNGTPEPALVYLEAVEFLNTQNSFDLTTKFVYWLHSKVQQHHGLLVLSVDPGAFSRSQVATLERDFNHVVRAT
ncbi:MAG: DUF835 domain-containing protein [Euryarchaeota archaeon]|nr:DUF835 domain-containing protein [Euryarchaeota archaeon]MDE1835750.1 DUF835 domain-containing protein [Euryarchaeota archaeon]MDE1882019.1 DUF835 domain-containing protein [Euryarchaeota archaeon]MDE2043941.1 DUF835 domain-containing protein [Thermoplasmata archaeon]